MNILRNAIDIVHGFAAKFSILVKVLLHQDFLVLYAFYCVGKIIIFTNPPAAEAMRLLRNMQSVAPVTGFKNKENI